MRNNIFVFVRHGECVKHEDKTAKAKAKELTPLGGEQAKAVGRWLKHIQLCPSTIIHTQTQRTKETAHHIIESLSDAKIERVTCRSGFRNIRGFESKWAQWGQTLTKPKVVIFVGHHSSQQTLTRCFKLPIKTKDRSIVVLEKERKKWTLVSWAYICQNKAQITHGSLGQFGPKDEP